MSRFRDALAACALAAACTVVWAQSLPPGIGRAATPAEVRAWDIDVRPDFQGLPVGSGSVRKGMQVWEAQCMSCHGVFGESNEVFQPLVGGTTRDDVRTGRVAALRSDAPRTTMMKLSTVSTLWDYINRAMPWQAPKSLSVEEVYAVTAYLLYLAEVVPGDFVLSDRNIRDVQNLIPNRYGKTTAHGKWLPDGRPDVRNTACMRDCKPGEPRITSALPAHARNAHGNLAEQHRRVGPVRAVDTTQPPGTRPPVAPVAPAAASR